MVVKAFETNTFVWQLRAAPWFKAALTATVVVSTSREDRFRRYLAWESEPFSFWDTSRYCSSWSIGPHTPLVRLWSEADIVGDKTVEQSIMPTNRLSFRRVLGRGNLLMTVTFEGRGWQPLVETRWPKYSADGRQNCYYSALMTKPRSSNSWKTVGRCLKGSFSSMLATKS